MPDKQVMLQIKAWDNGKTYEVLVDLADYARWMAGELIQFCFPDMDLDHRELLISGTSPEGFDAITGEDDD